MKTEKVNYGFWIVTIILVFLIIDTNMQVQQLKQNQTRIIFFDSYREAKPYLVGTNSTWMCSLMEDGRTGCVIGEIYQPKKGENK